MSRPDLANRAAVIKELRAAADDLLEEIDGGEECRGRDTTISMRAWLMERAADELEADAKREADQAALRG